MIANHGGYDAGNPDQDPSPDAAHVPKVPPLPEDTFERLGGIPPLGIVTFFFCTDERVPNMPPLPEDTFERPPQKTGVYIKKTDQLQLDPSQPGYGKLRPEVQRYFRAHALANHRLRKHMERDLIMKADDKQL